MISAFKIVFHRLRHPGLGDYIGMGYGIEARARRCANYWAKHLALCKEFLIKSGSVAAGKSLAVLGAGSLLDVPKEFLKDNFTHIAFYDANPVLKSKWKAFAKGLPADTSFIMCFKELSGSIEMWTEALKNLLRCHPGEKELIEFFTSLQCVPNTLIAKTFDCIYSLNLLSQIPIYWRDRVHDLLDQRLGVSTDDNGLYQKDLQAALQHSMALLQQQHLEMLATSGAKLVVIISDQRFLYYRRDLAPWQEEAALYVNSPIDLKNYRVEFRDRWYWHIAPQGIEQKEYGAFHDVFAISLKAVDESKLVSQ